MAAKIRLLRRKRLVMERLPLARPRYLWLTAPSVSIAANVAEANAFPFVRLKICKLACATQLQIPAKDAAEW